MSRKTGRASVGTTGGVAVRPARRRRIMPLIAAVAVALLVGSIGITSEQSPASAATYPTWEDVQEAKADVGRAAQEAASVRSLIAGLQQQVAAAQAEAEKKGTEYFEAQTAFDEADFEANELQAQADAAQVTADDSRQRAGRFIAELSRSGGGDLSASLFGNPDQAEGLLSRLGYASKITEQADGIYAEARRDQQAAQSLSDQAQVARTLREELRVVAEQALAEAQAAQQAAEAALVAQQENQVRLELQLEALEGALTVTEAQYQEGERIRIEEERKAREAAEAAARAERERAAAAAEAERIRREQEAAANAGNGGGGGGGGTGAGVPVSSGWARPSYGYVSSHFGNRIHPIYGDLRLHAGTDFAAGGGTPIFAVGGGTVTFAGWNGNYGYHIIINHGGGVTSSYSHIQQGGILVGYGAQVSAGQHIARTGTTGASTGPHLHLEMREGGGLVDPYQFLRARGVGL
ncbi:peptidoglycan DD-metalloendopeptidase family protein [Microcella daejeonensis]|uniref:M23 family metallopeptidase n=1 Tax=Microcella daejeonensis TaxID=2994971 RepID=UPI00226F786D|nr:M23 family metallopeptidase [Microcella daejeonensis]WAB84308.1 peptidoglycan DD-metalloendopeptidase family protein [Microcella daejeonensis]